MSLALSRLLPEFDRLAAPERKGARTGAPQPAQSASRDERQDWEARLESVRAQAWEEGHQAAETRLAARHAEEISGLVAQHAEQMQQQADQLARNLAAALPERISARAAAVADHLADDVAGLLAPLVEEALRRQMVARLGEEVRAALDLEHAARIVVRGPEIFLAAMRDQLGHDGASVDFVDAETADIELMIDETRLKSRFSELAQAFEEALR
ncbi:hypothetical protein [Pseudohoeflea coraliihabitans]|uniref:Flagellar assembly protein FliH/Type III secretion system HrpE domain-containing protein n=1 Tax=Pseudohoeflea coraliihabitans TaxID=2860393 RepID=A0ABS6WN96_9HYPH|nr:hypothetical protein [Pseudohoeflea sp. DP4N28-3]MBW3097360.1 hypothetical protein [Pseudohoeflea sp. DP4N28-3]